MAKVPPDVDERAAVKEAGFPSVLEQANRVTVDTPLTKTKPGEFTVSTVCANLVIADASPQQREQVVNVLVQRDQGRLGTRLVKAIIKAEDAKLHDGGDGSDDICMDMAEKTLEKHYGGGKHLVRTDDGSFWHYTGTHWHVIVDEEVKNRILDVVKSESPKMGYPAAVAGALGLLAVDQHRRGDVMRLLDESPAVINCLNGELWINRDGTAELRDHDPASYLTNCLNVTFDPKATCPTWDSAISATFEGDMELVRHFEEFGGYVIQPSRNIAAWFLFQGGGNNGKTKLMKMVRSLMGKDSVFSMSIDQVEKETFGVGNLCGKLMVLDDDMKVGTKLPDGFLKQISERKEMTGQHKFKAFFDFICTALPVMLTNPWPRVADLSYAFRRRAHVIPFNHQFVLGVDEDSTLFERILKDELPGVLNRFIAGLLELQKRGAFSVPAACERAKDELFRSGNPLQAYLDEGCVHDPAITTELGKFYKGFASWCDDEGRVYRDTRGTIKGKLEDLRFPIVKVGGNRNGVIGVRPMTSKELRDGVVADDPKDASPGDDEIPF